ncbi:3-dehydroquinate synthase [Sunxiuqinia elliptica]|uniref:3-dehydroquinate synthase n=1 Tax=Sunxiuqinia elliptica TaxID=655355 RepID=A0A4R6HA74_9BACT|nr:3-dehydroquinate synthase [Sunxiuqinia elliptica]TDO04887.1 3-dehydroquinate synthase [Sunxiuqinia elliptica]TDO64435.1 3-dehydroquinate synthase [Sunxiuqinia elliptica]
MTTSKIHSNIIFSQKVADELEKIVKQYPAGKRFLLTEETPRQLCLPQLEKLIDDYGIQVTSIAGGETNKSIRSVEKVWEFLSKNGADRKSLLINIGGGMLTDLGGFVASTFKRGMAFVNLPTTLLAQVDASLGGKTGINFNGLKNEIGVFNEPDAVIINTGFLKTIDFQNFLSGYAEMLKHGLIKNPAHWDELMNYSLANIDYDALQEIIAHSVAVKDWHVQNDLTEKNIRKALNFGHTVGHAFESYALHSGRPILHGYAVVYGMLVELYLSAKVCGFNQNQLKTISQWMLKVYGKFDITPSDYDSLYELMTHDKKNEGSRINFTLISEIGQVAINQDCSKELIFEALDFYREL